MSEKKSYLNYVIIRKTRAKAKVQMIVGVSMLAFYAVGLLGVIQGQIERYQTALIIALMVPAFYLVWCACNHYGFIAKAERYDKIFCKDKNGIITAHEMAEEMNMKYFDMFVELEKIFRRGYFVNCTLQQGRNPSVIINNAQVGDAKGVGFMQMVCPKCGASTRIRANSRGNCEYCGSIIQAPRTQKKDK
ncbi:hypothetical protein SAMN06297422_1403 [Lachnospiraceae bacterium]|nr:hypothetical protein SAMN06297422_1403 [Lachnospiraceae bacterium]